MFVSSHIFIYFQLPLIGTAKLWDLRSPNPSATFDCKSGVNSVALHPTRDEIITGDQNGSIKVWDLKTSKVINDIIPTDGKATNSSSSQVRQGVSIQSVDISRDGRTVMAATNHSNVFLWDYTDRTCFTPLTSFQAHPTGTYLTKAKISPDSRQLVTCSSDQTARLFSIYRPPDPPEEEKYHLEATPSLILNQHTKWVWDAVFSADSSYLVTASSDKKARLFNLRTGEVVKTYTGHQLTVTCVALNDSST
jgi:G protein beta subunit-like protein